MKNPFTQQRFTALLSWMAAIGVSSLTGADGTSLLPGRAVAVAAPEPAWQVEVNARARVESREQNFTFNRSVASATDDTWLLTRLRIGLKGKFSPAWSTYVQLQDSREFGSARPAVPFVLGSEGDDPLDLRQAYVEYKASDYLWRVGRQVLVFGDERLVGPLDWNNLSRSFDAFRLTLPKVGAGMDIFVSSVVQVQPGSKTGSSANHSSRDDLFAGLYSRFAPQPNFKIEPYVFWRQTTKDTLYSAGAAGTARPYDIPQKITTAGLRVVGGPADKLGGFDCDAELAGQTGEARGRQSVAGALVYPGPAWLEHRAWALHGGLGYSTRIGGTPLRLYAEVNRASGDRDPADGNTESFLNLFPTNHKFYGGMDVFAWKNLREFALTAATTVSGLKVRLEHHWFALDRVSDTWFRANAVTAVRPLTAAARQAAREAGTETDLVLSRALGKRITIEAGYSYFSAGRYLAQTGGASDARFFYLQTAFQW